MIDVGAAFLGCDMAEVEEALACSLLTPKLCAKIGCAVREVRHLPGDTAEVGIASGGTSRLIYAASGGKRHWACDTFDGLVDVGPEDSKLTNKMFQNVRSEVEPVLSRYRNMVLVEGYFPDSAPADMERAMFAFVHIDVDTYQSTLNCFRWFASRMCWGGIIALDDVLPGKGCAGAQQAWMELLRERKRWEVMQENPPQVMVRF
jgi:hypothetical protein